MGVNSDNLHFLLDFIMPSSPSKWSAFYKQYHSQNKMDLKREHEITFSRCLLRKSSWRRTLSILNPKALRLNTRLAHNHSENHFVIQEKCKFSSTCVVLMKTLPVVKRDEPVDLYPLQSDTLDKYNMKTSKSASQKIHICHTLWPSYISSFSY